MANAADSIAAIKKFVYDEHKISFNELKAAIADDFKNQEPLRQMLMNDAPKYGNDDDDVDEIARKNCGDRNR